MKKKRCSHCGQSFKAKRYDAVWCSPRCRVAHHRRMRNAGVTDVRLLNLADTIKTCKATLAGLLSAYSAPTCAGWNSREAQAFQDVKSILERNLESFETSYADIAAGGFGGSHGVCAPR
jgi:hypothetical protein